MLEAPAADPLDGRGGAAGRRHPGMAVGPPVAGGKVAADPDLPLLHAKRRGSGRQLSQALHPHLPAAGSTDDDGRLTNMETVHIDAYALILKTLGMPQTEFEAFRDYSAMKAKSD